MIQAIESDTPIAIETPHDADELARLLKKYSDERCAIIPHGGGTMSDLGATIERAAVILSLEKLHRILDYQPANLTVRVEAGATLDSLNRTLAEHGQFVPLDPPFPARATIGGILATNASGALRVRYGSARDLVIGMRVALTDGKVVKGGGQVVKNVAGYDLPKLFIGSLGTLGVIVEATFKVSPLPKKTGTLVASFNELSSACAIALRILQSNLLPMGIEFLNRAASAPLGFGVSYAVVVRFGGNENAVSQQLRQVEEWSRESNAKTISVLEKDDELWQRLRDFLFAKETVVKIGVLPTEVAKVSARVEEIAKRNYIECFLAAHAIGIVDAALEGADVAPAIEEMRQAAISLGGHLTIQRAPRALRERVDAWGPTRSDYGIMQKLKKEFDPNGVLNPGRFVGGI